MDNGDPFREQNQRLPDLIGSAKNFLHSWNLDMVIFLPGVIWYVS